MARAHDTRYSHCTKNDVSLVRFNAGDEILLDYGDDWQHR